MIVLHLILFHFLFLNCRPLFQKEKPVVRVSLEKTMPVAKTKTSKSRNGLEGAKEEKAKKKKMKQEKVEKTVPEKGVNLNDDLDFWLSASNGNDGMEKKVVAKGEITVSEPTMTPSKASKSKKEKKEKKGKKEKKEKHKKKNEKADDQSNQLLENVSGPPLPIWSPLNEDKNFVLVLFKLFLFYTFKLNTIVLLNRNTVWSLYHKIAIRSLFLCYYLIGVTN